METLLKFKSEWKNIWVDFDCNQTTEIVGFPSMEWEIESGLFT